MTDVDTSAPAAVPKASVSSGQHITVDYVKSLTAPTDGFLCAFEDNTYGIEFLSFRIRDLDNEDKQDIFSVSKDAPLDLSQLPPNFDMDQLRQIHYNFPATFLRLRKVGTQLRFKVGDEMVADFQMIERHYFKGRLIESFEYKFPLCIPNSENDFEAMYEMPALEEELVEDMINSPGETQSDSFYFVGDRLVMHNKATYTYL